MNAATVKELATPLCALRLLATDFTHLPAPNIGVSTIFPGRLELSFHGDAEDLGGFAAFETWRQALGVEPDAVEFSVQSGGRTHVLSAYAEFAGASVRLVAYGPGPMASAGGEVAW
ncbi:hypothetical protein [Streptomyces buecherae]|uniref:hypothetical protein n=1 Tax=Streptomyces buecherae TaxID=2763006 RepID=UPI001C252F7E|nr:hypothetical protein [Streptomyces buecherae]